MSDKLTVKIVIPIFNGRSDIKNSSCHKVVKPHKDRIKVEEKALGKRLHRIVTVNEIQPGFLPKKGTIDAVSILRGLQKEYRAKGKNCVL